MANSISTENDRPVVKDVIAQYFGRTHRWVELQVKNNKMPCIRLSKRTVRFRLRDVQVWMDTRMVN